MPAIEAGQKAVLLDEGATPSIIFQVTCRGARDNFGWVVPMPGKPGPGDVDQASQWFLATVEAMTPPAMNTEPPPRAGERRGLDRRDR